MRNHVPSWEDAHEKGFQTLPYSNIPNTTHIYVFILFTGVEGRSPEYEEPRDLRSNPFQGEVMMQSYPQGHWIEDFKMIGPRMQEKALGFS